MKQHVRGHYRRKPHSRELVSVSDYNRMIRKVEKEMGMKFEKKPSLILNKQDPSGGTNTTTWKVDQAQIQVDKNIARDNPLLAKKILYHELREALPTQNIPESNPDDWHDYALTKEGNYTGSKRVRVVDSPYALGFGEKGFVEKDGELQKYSRKHPSGNIIKGWAKKLRDEEHEEKEDD